MVRDVSAEALCETMHKLLQQTTGHGILTIRPVGGVSGPGILTGVPGFSLV
jgi:hypothetical protein